MFKMPEVMGMASSMSTNAEQRLAAVARNIANADTPGYRAQSVAPFHDSYRDSEGLALRTSHPGHLTAVSGHLTSARSAEAGGHMSPNGNNVSLEAQMVEAAAIRKDHDLALSIYKTSLEIMRSSLGR
ncbi:MAG: FlgB family protein [Paracoccaceae bacterium]